MSVFVKDPSAVLDYGFDWIDWLESSEVVATSTWMVPTGLTKDSDTNDGTITAVWLSGGTANTDYTVVNHIVTSDGREEDRSHIIRVRNR